MSELGAWLGSWTPNDVARWVMVVVAVGWLFWAIRAKERQVAAREARERGWLDLPPVVIDGRWACGVRVRFQFWPDPDVWTPERWQRAEGIIREKMAAIGLGERVS